MSRTDDGGAAGVIPAAVSARLSSPVYERENPSCVDEALAALGVQAGGVFVEFYKKYQGPFGSNVTGFELLDMCDQSPNVVIQTEICRSVHSFAARFLVLTDLLGGGVLVYDSRSDEVFNVDFEGGDSELADGTLAAQWPSFALFLEEYFS